MYSLKRIAWSVVSCSRRHTTGRPFAPRNAAKSTMPRSRWRHIIRNKPKRETAVTPIQSVSARAVANAFGLTAHRQRSAPRIADWKRNGGKAEPPMPDNGRDRLKSGKSHKEKVEAFTASTFSFSAGKQDEDKRARSQSVPWTRIGTALDNIVIARYNVAVGGEVNGR